MMRKDRQIGPPLRVGDYQVSVTDSDHGTLVRAVLVDETNRDLPRRIAVEVGGLNVDASNVATDSLVFIPSDVLRALLKAGGWKQVER